MGELVFSSLGEEEEEAWVVDKGCLGDFFTTELEGDIPLFSFPKAPPFTVVAIYVLFLLS